MGEQDRVGSLLGEQETVDPDVVDELEDVQAEMADLLSQAKRLVRQCPDQVRARAEAYWVGHLASAIGGESGQSYLGSQYETSMQTTIDELREEGRWAPSTRGVEAVEDDPYEREYGRNE